MRVCQKFETFDQTPPADLPALALGLAGGMDQQRRDHRRDEQRGVGKVRSLDAEKIDNKSGDHRCG